MEITPVPHPSSTLSRGRVVGALLVIGPVIVLVFLPTVLGLQRYVVADDAMDGTDDGSIGRGAIALTREVPGGDLVVGDVITFRPPVENGVTPGASVTRRIVSIEDGVARTRGDANDRADPWQLDVTAATFPRVVVAVPLIGHPFTGDAGEGGWVLLVLGAVLALVLAAGAPWRRLRERHRATRDAVHGLS